MIYSPFVLKTDGFLLTVAEKEKLNPHHVYATITITDLIVVHILHHHSGDSNESSSRVAFCNDALRSSKR